MSGKRCARLRVIFGIDDARKMILPNGISDSVDALIKEVQFAFQLIEDIRLQYKDNDFNEFLNLTLTSELEDLSTIKVVYVEKSEQTVERSQSPLPVLDDCSSVMSGDTDDTVISSLSTRTQAWPKVFQIPQFSSETELQLEKGNAEYRKKKMILTVSSKTKSDILQKLAEEIFRFKAYPQDANFCEVSEALIKKHPCLQEPGSYNGCSGWKQRLKYKMGNYRTQMKLYGCPELAVNSVKNKAREGDSVYPAKNVKKAKRAEANYLPDLPQGETPESLEADREMLMREAKKRNNERVIRELMAKTFAYRRHEVVKEQPRVEDFMKRWPALFKVNEINAEFLRITTIPLQSKFLAQLDKYTNKLTSIIRHKGGAAHYKTASFIQAVDQKNDVNIRREFVLRSLIIYLGEDDKDLIKEYLL
ncbi:uncharacterized protein LOC114652536 isoform X2 [Erpetoichthys calabaricus]|uniref:uncharacterized protein LOC114652536 isoform X2 n=1 Tax=Erpetoichthys calabaricus TaxID=27687 RepID=UPI002233EC18|nr:uncharacterized protein LOC114652536 isoform X2 [Erpetoichthys calabaricus]